MSVCIFFVVDCDVVFNFCAFNFWVYFFCAINRALRSVTRRAAMPLFACAWPRVGQLALP